MKWSQHCSRLAVVLLWAILPVGLLLAGRSYAQSSGGNGAGSPQQSAPKDDKKQESHGPPTAKLKIQVKGSNGNPIGNASVYLRFDESGGFLHHEKHVEMNFRTNEDGSVKTPPVPQGKILIQVIATGWRTYGKYYDIGENEEAIEIILEPPPHWY